MAEDDSRVGERRITSTETVTGWARIGSSARRAYRDAPSFIYACDAAATGADFNQIDRRWP